MFVRARPWKGLPLLRLSWRVSGKNRKHHCYLKQFQYSRLVRYHFPLTPPPDEDSSCKTSRTQDVSLTSNDQSPSETILARPPKKAWAAMGWSPTPPIWPETLVLETLVLFVGLRKTQPLRGCRHDNLHQASPTVLLHSKVVFEPS